MVLTDRPIAARPPPHGLPFGNRIVFPPRWLIKLALRVLPGETLRLAESYVLVRPLDAVAIKGLNSPTPAFFPV
jgi:hypothetical protein